MRVVIMGGTAGIGLATAEALYADGAEVIVTGRNPERLAAVRTGSPRPSRWTALTRQLSPRSSPRSDRSTTSSWRSRPAPRRRTLRPAHYRRCTGSVRGQALRLPVRHPAGAGHWFHHDDLGGLGSRRMPGMVGLSAVNGATERVVAPLAAELAPVRVNAVAPGAIDTAWWSFLDDETKRRAVRRHGRSGALEGHRPARAGGSRGALPDRGGVRHGNDPAGGRRLHPGLTALRLLVTRLAYQVSAGSG